MRSFLLVLVGITLFLQTALSLSGAEFRLTNGDVIRGEASAFNEDGFVVRLEIGGFSPRISWSKLTQETLKELAKNPQAAKFAEPFIEVTAEEIAEEKKKKEIKVQPVPTRIEQPAKTSFFGSLTSTPIGILSLVVLYLANLYAAYEIARFRNRPAGLVCGLSAVLPIVGPIIFLSMPPAHAHVEEAPVEAAESGPIGNPLAQPGAGSAGGLGLAGGKKEGAAAVDTSVYKRGDTTFNRRFFETKFAGFFRVVPSEAEKDYVIVIRAAKNEYVGKRISRISATDLHLMLLRGGNEVQVPFTEVNEVQVRHKDAKA